MSSSRKIGQTTRAGYGPQIEKPTGKASSSLSVQGMTNLASERIATENVKIKARITVCHFAEDSEEATTFMKMLGIHPSQKGEEGLTDITYPQNYDGNPHSNTPHTPPRRLQ